MLWAPSAWAGSSTAAADLNVRLGFEGIVKIGVPLPLDVIVPRLERAGPAVLAVDAPALGPEMGRVVTSTVVPFVAVPGASQLIHASVVISDPRRPLMIRVSVAGQEVVRYAARVSPDMVAERLLVALSDDRAGLASLHRLSGRVQAVYVAASALPRLWQEYAAVDLLVIRDLDPGSLDATQQEALRTWIHLGGRLTVIARPSHPLPPMLDPILPATAGDVRAVPRLPSLTTAFGGALPPGPFMVTTLAARPGTHRVSEGTLTIMAAWDAGRGRVMVWGIDPWQPPWRVWSGRLRLWDAALGRDTDPVVDPAAVAEKLTVGTPLDPLLHAEVGGAIILYIALILALLRWRRSFAGAAGSLIVVVVALGTFTLLGERTRARSATLTQVTLLEPVFAMRAARATTVAAVAVPYGGRYRVFVPRGVFAHPVTPSSSLRIERVAAGTELTGTLRSSEPPRPFEAVGVVPIGISASLSADGRWLAVDLGNVRAHHAELRRRDRIYPLADLPPGRTVTEIHGEGWIPATAPGRTLSEFSQHLWEAIFQSPAGGAILNGTTPVLVAELEQVAPVFTLGDAATPGQWLTLLLVPLEQR